jgi:DNA polymerase
MFVGEAPGEDEDLQGEPFVGRAGQLLTKMIEAMELKRTDVYIANILKCRPPNNRPPQPEEIAACSGFISGQLGTIKPRVVCALGKFAAQFLLGTDEPISALRGRFHKSALAGGVNVMPTFHPAYILRNPASKRQVWEDLKKIMKEIA